MRHIVTGLFESSALARHASDTLIQQGFPASDISLQPTPGASGVTGAAATPGAPGAPAGGEGVLAGIERFISSFFATSPELTPGVDDAETAALRDALKRGAALVCVNAPDEARASTARVTLLAVNAIEVGEHDPGWRPPDLQAEAAHERSALDELGISALANALRKKAHTAATAREEAAARRQAAPGPVVDVDTTTSADAAVTAVASASAPGAGAVMAGGLATPVAPASASATVPVQPVAGGAPQIPDEFLEYEEDFRDHHAQQYAPADEPYEIYEDAYRYGAQMGRDERYAGSAWADVEADLQRGWESRSHETWDRIKDAVRHGWNRVTGQQDW